MTDGHDEIIHDLSFYDLAAESYKHKKYKANLFLKMHKKNHPNHILLVPETMLNYHEIREKLSR